jgi:tripartite ATP-independent transporter DctP family solute receptor
MTVSRKIILLVCCASLACLALFSVALFGFSAIHAEIGKGAQAIERALDSAQVAMIVTLLVGLALLAVLCWLALRAIVKPLKVLETAVVNAADKLDFTEQFSVGSDDEIGCALQAYNRLTARLCASFGEIQQASANLRELSEEMNQSSRKIARNSQLQSDASSNMAAAVEEMTVSIAAVAEQATDASRHTQQSRDIAEHSSGVILNTVRCIELISEIVGEAATRIKALRGDCDSISSMARMIREIADQTNLLALNAAIEAARAGEQGRGFAVVADEVRKLAERTTASTGEISALLDRMQESSRQAVASMERTEKAVEDGVVNARQAGESIEKIKSGADAAAIVVAEISGAMREQETASSTIARNIEQIAQMSEQNSSSASTSATGVGRVTQAGLEIARSVSVYRVDTAEQKIVLRSADIHPASHPAVRAVQSMAESLARRSHGRITLKVLADGALGTDTEVFAQLKDGAIDMMRVSPGFLNKDVPATVVQTLPFVFDSVDHMHRAMDGAPGREILEACAASGFIGLTYYEGGVRCVYANKAIRKLADMRDLKVRIMQSELWTAVVGAMGARPVPMQQDEVLAGARTGLIDAAENNVLVFDTYKHYDAFKYFCHTEHTILPELLIFSKKKWETLAADDRQLIAEAARESTAVMRRLWKESEETARKNCLGAGTTFIKDVDKTSFQNAMRPVYDKFIVTPQQKALFQAIKAMK